MISILSLLFAVLFICKLLGFITASWFLVFVPFLLAVFFVVVKLVAFLGVLIAAAVSE